MESNDGRSITEGLESRLAVRFRVEPILMRLTRMHNETISHKPFLGNGCLADEFYPHDWKCKCDRCETIWQELRQREAIRQSIERDIIEGRT